MFLQKCVVMTALLVAVAQGQGPPACPPGCTCQISEMFCSGLGLDQPPAGYWPSAATLVLYDNNIRDLPPGSLSGFPNLMKLYLNGNPLQKLDMNVLFTYDKLMHLEANDCFIREIVPLTTAKQFPSMMHLYLDNNKITEIPENLLWSFPRLINLYINNNPLVLPGDKPLGPADNLRTLSLNGVDGSKVSNLTFINIRIVEFLYLEYAKISDISGVFSNIQDLTYLSLEGNPIWAVKAGAFSKNQTISSLNLRSSSVAHFEPIAIDGVVKSLDISETPLACLCWYDALYWWAQTSGNFLKAQCGNNELCTRNKKEFH